MPYIPGIVGHAVSALAVGTLPENAGHAVSALQSAPSLEMPSLPVCGTMAAGLA